MFRKDKEKEQYVDKEMELKIKELNENCNNKIHIELICGGDCQIPYMKVIYTNAKQKQEAVAIKCMAEIANEMINAKPELKDAVQKIHFVEKQSHTKRVIR